MTYSVSELHEYLKDELPGQDDRLFGFAARNFIGAEKDYLFDTPHGSWDNPDLKPGHSAQFLQAISDHIASAKHLVDILTMERPTGLFFRALTHGFARIADVAHPKPVTVRLLMGKVASTDIIDIEEMLNGIIAAMPNRAGRIDFYVGQTRWEMASWNHAKAIAVDGARMIVGGHNLWAADYLESEPVFDISMRVDGEVTRGAHQFAESLWGFVRKANTIPGTHTFSHRLTPDFKIEKNKVPAEMTHGGGTPSGSMPALWVTCPGWGIFADGNNRRVIKDGAVLCLVRGLSKATHCRMSLQDLGSDQMGGLEDFKEYEFDGHPYKLIACKGYYFILPVIDAIAEFLSRNATNPMEIVLTSSAAGGKDYSHRVPPSVIYNVISSRMAKNHGQSKKDCLSKFSAKLTLGNVSFSGGRNRWPNGNNPIRNHAKFWILDGKLLYIGSGNLYPYVKALFGHRPGYHPEFGILADLPQTAVQMIVNGYYGSLVKFSQRARAELGDMTWKEP
jgi:hypothetical protein